MGDCVVVQEDSRAPASRGHATDYSVSPRNPETLPCTRSFRRISRTVVPTDIDSAVDAGCEFPSRHAGGQTLFLRVRSQHTELIHSPEQGKKLGNIPIFE